MFDHWDLAMCVDCMCCTDRLQPLEAREQSLAWPDLAQSGLSLQETGPLPDGGAGGDTWTTAVRAGAPI